MDLLPYALQTLYSGANAVIELSHRDKPTNSNDLPAKRGTIEFQRRVANVSALSQKYPDRIPVIAIMHNDLQIDKSKFLVPRDLTFGQLMYVIRKRITMSGSSLCDQALYGIVNGYMIPTHQILSVVADQHRYDDGMLYVHVYLENTFGE